MNSTKLGIISRRRLFSPTLIFATGKSTDASIDPAVTSTTRIQKIQLPDRYVGQPSWKTHAYLMEKDETTPGITRTEYAQRRESLMAKLLSQNMAKGIDSIQSPSCRHHLVVFQAAPVTFSAPDVPHPFRQDSNFLYLTGFQEPDSVLVLYNDENVQCRSALFVAQRNEYKELWEGPRAGLDGALALTGVDFVYEKQELGDFLRSYVKRHLAGQRFAFWRDPGKQIPMASTIEKPFIGKEKQPFVCADIDVYLSQFPKNGPFNPIPALHSLRWIKSPSEIALLRRAGKIGGEALLETMRFSRPNIVENVLAAKMDLECRLRGANHLAYPPVIAGGSRANVIHYLNNDQRILESENLVLMDAGCEVDGYVSDISRTWPVSGRFTDPQRVLYEIVYNVQVGLLEYVNSTRPISLKDMFLAMLELLAFNIREAGILKNPPSESMDEAMDEAEIRQADKFCPHHVSHYLGMDVHDTDSVPKDIDLQPGVVITVEPGIYIKPDNPRVKDEFRGYGIRIEDDVLITETGAELLSGSCPKSATDIERIMQAL